MSATPRDDASIEIDPRDALARQGDNALLIDVREDDERAAGIPAGAIGIARAAIPREIARIAPDRSREILTICASGKRSLLAAATLRELGYARVASVRGGVARWQAEAFIASCWRSLAAHPPSMMLQWWMNRPGFRRHLRAVNVSEERLLYVHSASRSTEPVRTGTDLWQS